MEAEAAATTGETPPRARLAAFDALQARDFRYLWLNSFSFFVASGMRMVAVSWLVLVFFARGSELLSEA